MVIIKNFTNIKRKKSNICIICNKKILKQNNYFPFCSKYCSDIDLSKWLGEKYYINENSNNGNN